MFFLISCYHYREQYLMTWSEFRVYSTTKWFDTDLKSEWVSEKINFNMAISYQRGKEFTNGSNYKTQN